RTVRIAHRRNLDQSLSLRVVRPRNPSTVSEILVSNSSATLGNRFPNQGAADAVMDFTERPISAAVDLLRDKAFRVGRGVQPPCRIIGVGHPIRNAFH